MAKIFVEVCYHYLTLGILHIRERSIMILQTIDQMTERSSWKIQIDVVAIHQEECKTYLILEINYIVWIKYIRTIKISI